MTLPTLLHQQTHRADSYWGLHLVGVGNYGYLTALGLPADSRVVLSRDPGNGQVAPTVTVRVYACEAKTFPKRHPQDLVGVRRVDSAPGFKPQWLVMHKTPSGEYHQIGTPHSSALAARAFVRGMAYAEGIDVGKYVHTF